MSGSNSLSARIAEERGEGARDKEEREGRKRALKDTSNLNASKSSNIMLARSANHSTICGKS